MSRLLSLVLLFALGYAAVRADEERRPKAHDTVRIAGIVLKWIRGDKETNFRRVEPMIREAARAGAQIIVTTECFLDGYSIADKSIPLDEYRALGEPIPDGPYYKRLAALARELRVHVIAGITEADGENRYNTAVFINPDGELAGKYRKQKLGHEIPRNTPGNVSTVHATQFGKMGIMICADRTDPQIVQKYSVNGADFLICPSGGNFGPRSNDPIVQARSRENHIPIVFVHPTEFLVTAPDGAIQRQLLLGDRLFIEKAQMGSDLDCNQVCCFDLPVKRVGSIGDAGGE